MIALAIMGKGLVDIPGLYDIEEAATALNVGIATIFRWMKSGKLIPLDVGGRTLISRSEVERIKREQNNQAVEKTTA